MAKLETFVSVVMILPRRAERIEEVIRQTHALLETHYSNFELLVLNDQGGNAVGAKASSLLSSLKCIRLITLSPTMSMEIALVAGLESAIGDFVVTMQPDRDPPSAIPAMIQLAGTGYDVVAGVCADERYSPIQRIARKIFYGLCGIMIEAPLIPGATAFRVHTRQAVNALTRIRQRWRDFSLLLADVGFQTVTYPYTQLPRLPGAREPGLASNCRRGVKMIIHNSSTPLRLISLVGLLGSFLSFAYAGYVLVVNICRSTVMPGWTTQSLQTSGLFFLIFLMLTIFAEYLDRIVDEVSERPLYHVQTEKNSSVMLADALRTNVLDLSVEESPKTRS